MKELVGSFVDLQSTYDNSKDGKTILFNIKSDLGLNATRIKTLNKRLSLEEVGALSIENFQYRLEKLEEGSSEVLISENSIANTDDSIVNISNLCKLTETSFINAVKELKT